MSEKNTIYTIGYTLFKSSYGVDVDALFKELKRYGVSYLIDVRSVPYSKQYPQCNSDMMKVKGKQYGIPYVHMPELGAKADPDQDVFSPASDIFFEDIFPISKSNRPEKSELKANEEIVDFSKFRKSENIHDGLKRIETAYDKGFVLALMCSEKNPMDCHRYFILSKRLEEKFSSWLRVEHIVKNKSGEITTCSNEELDLELQKYIMDKAEIKKLQVMSASFYGPAPIDNYYGDSLENKVMDFCDRYWNLMHGWKKVSNTNQNIEEYD